MGSNTSPVSQSAPRQQVSESVLEQRLEDVDTQQLLHAAQEALIEFSGAVDDRCTEAEIVGAYIVGSTLTDEFRSGASDLDVIFLSDQHYPKQDGFCRMLTDKGSACRAWLNAAVGQAFTGVDPLGLYSPAEAAAQVRQPARRITRRHHVTE